MSSLRPDTPLSALSRCQVFPAAALTVETGALMGDAIGDLTEVAAGDVYRLEPDARAAELILSRASGRVTVAPGSMLGQPGKAVTPLARHRLMSERGVPVEVLVLATGGLRLALPLGPFCATEDYTLIASEPVAGELASVASVSFARGTRITLASGLQRPVEELAEGDRILTRDHGPQPIRWIERQTVRAEGLLAPVVIAKGALGNEADLVLSPDHRLFLYRGREGELLVRARDLVDAAGIRRAAGGHVDYFHLLFDAHEIIYAEGIPAESLLVTPEVLAGLGEDLAADLTARQRPGASAPHPGVEPSSAELARLGLGAGSEGGRR
ncbi:Hint domain-containing protein [Jannaschia seohaensis]|uniref:Hint domain-containing protein n=1 Tax=Jannaschia seohaensis TaxID=475081 RepID=A0A2Y9A590_9RHOB|nr:Hint domain-containing protein [Jannaschia seohaensis]PWJ22340.1 Hint domain-containing protein [Jannaschia seohaensis]SSA38618.1 Hint domain-containing protein [Jannaschia seohaensis]